MNKELKVFVVGPATYYAKWINDSIIVDNPEEADIIMFTGGEDVDPSLYNAEKHIYTGSNIERDLRELAIFEKYPRKFKLGICRGSQLMCVANGGKLVQDCNNHAIGGTHKITFDNGAILPITSTHHQMAYPFNLKEGEDYELVAVSTEKLSTYYDMDNATVENLENEPEITWYPKTNTFAIQGHPQMMDNNSDTVIYLNEVLRTYLKEAYGE